MIHPEVAVSVWNGDPTAGGKRAGSALVGADGTTTFEPCEMVCEWWHPPTSCELLFGHDGPHRNGDFTWE